MNHWKDDVIIGLLLIIIVLQLYGLFFQAPATVPSTPTPAVTGTRAAPAPAQTGDPGGPPPRGAPEAGSLSGDSPAGEGREEPAGDPPPPEAAPPP